MIKDVTDITITYIVEEKEYYTVTLPYGSEMPAVEEPSKPGCTFAGWNREIPTTVPANDLTLTAKWTTNKYVITYLKEDLGNNWLPDITGSWTFNQSYLGAKSVTMNLKLGEKGDGYASYSASGFYGVITFGCTVHSNREVSLVLYARNGARGSFSGTFNEDFTNVSGDSYVYGPDDNNWAVSPWTVDEPWSFSVNGVSSFIPDDMIHHRDTVSFGSVIPNVAVPVKDGYRLSGWSQDVPETMPAQNLMVFPVWERDLYNVTYIVADTVYHSATGTMGGEVLLPDAPVRTGYTFDGWDGMPTDGIMPAQNITLTAKWRVNSYTITYMSDGAVYHTATLDYGADVPAVPAPTKTGYTFVGWDAEVPATMPAHDLTLTAKWNRVYRRTWDFRNGYSTTTLEAMAHDTKNWAVYATGFQNTAHTTTTPVMECNGEEIVTPEFEGLTVGAFKDNAHLQVYDGKSNNSSFPANTACLWINGGKAHDYVEFVVPAGENVKFGYCSHSDTQARGFKTSSEGFADADGKTQWTSMADGTIKEVELINSNTEESTLRLNTTNGSHIYYIIIGDGDTPGAGMVSPMQIYDNEPTQINAAGFSTMTYSDGASVSLTGRADKAYSNGLDITINDAQYTTTKVSNGSQNTFYAPKGKRIYSFTLYSYINLDTKNRNTCWNEVGNVVYDFNKNTEMLSYKDGSNPDKYTYVFSGGVDSVTFTNTGEQVAFVIGVNYLTENFPTVTYIVDGAVYHSGSCIPGQKIQVAIAPEKTGYTFAGWDGMPTDGIMPSQDLTLTALWTVNKYGLNYILDDERLRVDSIAYGATIVPAIPDARLGCEFGGWEGIPSVMPANDVTVYGYNHIIDTEEVALDGHLTNVLLSEINALTQVRALDLGAVTNSSLPIGGLATLQTAVLPAGLTGYDGVLTDCPNLLEVTLNSNVEIPSGAFRGSGTNTNMIVYAPENTSNKYDGNVVIGGIAENITLQDGLPLSISTEFTARNISYSREFSKVSYPSECGGWETIVLPFDVMEITNNGNSLAPFNNGTAGVKNFWLADLAPMGFGNTPRIQANVPYIISMPNSEIYESSYNITGTVTFSATDAVVRRTSEAHKSRCAEFDMIPTYNTVESGMDVYPLNDEDYDVYHAGAVFVSNLRSVRPFEAYARRRSHVSLAKTMFVIGDVTPTGIMGISTNAEAGSTTYFDLLGRPTTSSDNGLRIMRDANGRYVKTVGRR
ncbi:MAG: InlB B-repeat-containing protein [Prevotellaceae bacterium]|nr:InlB B-repeat-containing protein [Prevotellaceae bacterium]